MARTITDSSGTSHFLNSPHRKGDEDLLVFSPIAASPFNARLLVFLHGHDLQKQTAATLDAYLRAVPDKRDLRPVLRDKAVILAHPWVGTRSDYGWLKDAKGVEALLDVTLKTAFATAANARANWPLPMPSSIIIAGHSGGGAAVQAIARRPPPAHWWNLVRELWVLDGMYSGEAPFWTDWCRDNPKRTLRVAASSHKLSRKPRAQAEALTAAKLTNIQSEVADVAHLDFPLTYVAKWL